MATSSFDKLLKTFDVESPLKTAGNNAYIYIFVFIVLLIIGYSFSFN